MAHIGTVFTDEATLLKAIIALHSPQGIELDPMYNKGNFYKDIKKPKYQSDIRPLTPYCKHADATNLSYNDDTISSMILDPPFMFGNHGKQSLYYSSKTHGILQDEAALLQLYTDLLKEAYRILKKKGVLIYKCQDYTDSKTTMTHCHVWSEAKSVGFYPKDLAILYKHYGKVANHKLNQRHLRKHHTYFWVFTK